MAKAAEINKRNEDFRRAFFVNLLLAAQVKNPPSPQKIYEALWPPDPATTTREKLTEKEYLIKAFKLK